MNNYDMLTLTIIYSAAILLAVLFFVISISCKLSKLLAKADSKKYKQYDFVPFLIFTGWLLVIIPILNGAIKVVFTPF